MRASFIQRGGGWVVAQSILMLAVIVLAVGYPGDWTNVGLMTTGGCLMLAGGWLGIAGVRDLGRNRTPFPQPCAGSTLVRHGIYGRVRHPLYTSVMLASLGWALIWQSLASFVAALVLIPFFRAKARHEEVCLRAAFSHYADYARSVPPFLPRLRPGPPFPIV